MVDASVSRTRSSISHETFMVIPCLSQARATPIDFTSLRFDFFETTCSDMRQRITYLLPEGTGIDPADIQVTKDELKYSKIDQAAEERRITLGLNELPEDVGLESWKSSLI